MPSAIILAAGESRRMGRSKALLPDPAGRPFVARLVRTFAAAGIRDIVVVTGANDRAVREALAADIPPVDPVVVENPEPARGQLSSLWIGLDAIPHAGADAAIVTPVDIPMTNASTIRAVIEAWSATHPPIARPRFRGRHGHPVLFDRSTFGELRLAPLQEGARAVVHAHADRLIDVDVQDEGSVIDVDTPEDYRQLTMRWPAVRSSD